MSNLKEEFESWGGFEGYCEVCDSYSLLQKHHVSYSPERTKSICSDCHYKIHQHPGFHDDLNPFSIEYENSKAERWDDDRQYQRCMLVKEAFGGKIAHKLSDGEIVCGKSEGETITRGDAFDVIPECDHRCTHCWPKATQDPRET